MQAMSWAETSRCIQPNSRFCRGQIWWLFLNPSNCLHYNHALDLSPFWQRPPILGQTPVPVPCTLQYPAGAYIGKTAGHLISRARPEATASRLELLHLCAWSSGALGLSRKPDCHTLCLQYTNEQADAGDGRCLATVGLTTA